MPEIKIAVIGHIDHGKSTTLGRLLFDSGQVKPDRIEEVKKSSPDGVLNYAYFLDNFEEEQAGEMTIDVCYVRYRGPEFLYIFIDTPGHKEFVKNMLTGASHAEAAVLLISAAPDEGIQEQTIRHLKLAKLLGINQLVVAINKMDKVGYEQKVFEQIKNNGRSLLTAIGFPVDSIPFVPISAWQGDNVYHQSVKMSWYQGKSLIKEIEGNFKPRQSFVCLPLRMIVQDVYDFTDPAMVIGKVEAGVLKIGDEIIFQPSAKIKKIKELRIGEQRKKQVESGAAIGIVLEGSLTGIKRGEVAGLPKNPPEVCQQFIGQIYFLEEKPIKEGNRFLLRCGLAESLAEIKDVLEKEEEFAKVKIYLEKPLVIEKYQDFPSLARFIMLQDKKNVGLGVRI